MKHLFNPDRSKLILEINEDEKIQLKQYDNLSSDENLYDFFDRFICNSEFEWTSSDETGDLTSAPMLCTRLKNGDVDERWVFMDYQVVSVLRTLFINGKVVFIS